MLGRIQVAGQVLAAQTLGCQVRDKDPTTRRRQDWGVADLSSYPTRKAKRPSGQRILRVRTEAGPPPAWRERAEGR